jgi:hypothetical protein
MRTKMPHLTVYAVWGNVFNLLLLIRSQPIMKAITGTWNTLKNTFTLIAHYRVYSIYPLFSYLVMLFATFVAIIPLMKGVLGSDRNGIAEWAIFVLAIYVAYGLLYGVIAFCNVALVAGIATQLDGDNSFKPLARAIARLKLISVYTMVSAMLSLVSFFARLLVNPLVGGVIAPLIGDKLWVRWQQLSYKIPLQLAIPIVALDQPAPENIFERGEQLVKATWGERVKPAHNISLLSLIVVLFVMSFAIPIIGQGLDERNSGLLWQGLSITLVAIATYTQVNALVNAIFALAAYRYATTNKSDLVPGDASYAQYAFVQSKKETDQSDLARQIS